MVAVAAASLAQRTRLRSTPMLVSAARLPVTAASTSRASRGLASAAASTPAQRSSSLSTTLAYNRATFTRVGVAFRAQSNLLAGKPFSSAIARRNLSFWSSSKPASTTSGDQSSSLSSEIETKKEQVIDAVNDLSQSSKASIHDVESSLSEGLHSTQQAASDAVSTLQSKASQVSSTLTEQLSNVDATAASTVTEAFSGAMGVIPGELTELGLNHWVTPPGWITNLLEFVGTTTGLPWWGTITITTVALRLLIAPISIAGQKNAIRLGNIQPEMKRNMDDIKHYKAAGDQMQMQKAVMATQKLLRDNNANPIKSLVPILFQFPLMFSYFLALERIAKSGSESFAHGGPFWTTDLTVPDPTWILPAISTLATFAVAEVGFKVGTNSQSDPAQSQMMKYIFRGFMPILAWFSTTFPSGVLVYWATTNLYSLAQLAILQVPLVRKWAKFPKRITHPKNPYQQEANTFMDKLRAAKDRMSDSSATHKPVKPVAATSTASTTPTQTSSRSDALNEILNDKSTYEASATTTNADAQSTAAQRNRERVLKARQRRARQ